MDCLDTINRMRTRLGLLGDATAIQLPQCVIAGDQSSGKSSLLEAYSGVLLPFGSGTQTRCPTEIDMHPLPKGSTKEQRIFKVNDVEVGISDLIEAIKTAQAKILEDEYGTAGEEAAGQFSSTAIRVHASTEFPQRLTILDMPGLHARKEEGSETAKRMLVQRIDGPRSLIIAVGEAGTDEARHTSFQLARDADEQGRRTIQVFTKCDVTDGPEANRLLVERIAKAAEQLAGGGPTARFAHHFVVARVGGSRDGWSPEAEMAVFRDQLHVTEALLKSGVVGVASLRDRTEELLRDLVMNNVPKMLAEVRSKSEEYAADLQKIGESPAQETAIVRACVDSVKDAISELGRLTCATTDEFDTLARRISTTHASDETAVREEVIRRMSPHEIPWFLGRFAFQRQLKSIGDGFRDALRVHAKALMGIIRPCVTNGIVRICSDEAQLRPQLRSRLLVLCGEALSQAEARVHAEFDALASRNSSFYTRNGHYIDGGKAADAAVEAEAELLASALAGVTPLTKEAVLMALRAMHAMRPPRSIEDQVVSRVMGDLERVAKAQLKEFLSAVNAIVKEEVVESLTEWADCLSGDSLLRSLAQESPARLRRREELKEKLAVAAKNERELRALGFVDQITPLHVAEEEEEEDDAGAGAASASSRAAALAEQMRQLGAALPSKPAPPRSKADFVELVNRTLGELADKRAAGVFAWTSIAELALGSKVTDAETTAFQLAMAELNKPLPTDGTSVCDQCYTSTFSDGRPAVGMRRARPRHR